MAAPKRRSSRTALTVAGVVAILGLCTIAALSNATAEWLSGPFPEPREPCDVILVLNGDEDFERTQEAARRYLKNEAPVLLLSGDEHAVGGDNPLAMRDEAVRHGVPPSAIWLERSAKTTRENIVFSSAIMKAHRVKRVLLVTHPFHLRRARAVAIHHFPPSVELFAVPAQSALYRVDSWWRRAYDRRKVVSEYGKLVYYWLRGWI